MKLAPIALFVYNRPWHTKKTVEALQKNILATDSDLIIFSDGPKDSPESKLGVLEVREYLKTITGFKNIKIINKEKNCGLAESIITGVTNVVNEYGRIIVLEDDMISSLYFLKYLNEGLNLYENSDKVISIHSYIYPIKESLPETYFLKGADCWGWATWERGWNLFEKDGKTLLAELEKRKLTKKFDFDGTYPFTQMLKDQISGGNNSWAIRWYASAFLENKLTLYPRKSLIYNTGLDNSGTHCDNEDNFNTKGWDENTKIKVEKIEIEENPNARIAVESYFKKLTNFRIRAYNFIKRKFIKLKASYFKLKQ